MSIMSLTGNITLLTILNFSITSIGVLVFRVFKYFLLSILLFCGNVFFIQTKYCDLPYLHRCGFKGFLLLLFKNKYIKLIDKRLSNKS